MFILFSIDGNSIHQSPGKSGRSRGTESLGCSVCCGRAISIQSNERRLRKSSMPRSNRNQRGKDAFYLVSKIRVTGQLPVSWVAKAAAVDLEHGATWVH